METNFQKIRETEELKNQIRALKAKYSEIILNQTQGGKK